MSFASHFQDADRLLLEGIDAYALLDVSRAAVLHVEALRKAYKLKAKQVHPDLGGTDDAFKDVRAAFDVLSNSTVRGYYDRQWTAQYGKQDIAATFLREYQASLQETAPEKENLESWLYRVAVSFAELGLDVCKRPGLGAWRNSNPSAAQKKYVANLYQEVSFGVEMPADVRSRIDILFVNGDLRKGATSDFISVLKALRELSEWPWPTAEAG